MNLEILLKKGWLTKAEAENIGTVDQEYWSFDFETLYGGDLTLRTMGTLEYVQQAPAYLVGIASTTGESYAGPLEDFDWSKLEGKHLVAHNAGFDELVLERAMEVGQIPRFKPASISCSMQACAYHGLPRSLKKVSHYMFGRTVKKDIRDYMENKTFEDAVEDGRSEELIEYAQNDAIDCLRVWLTLEKDFPEVERFISQHTRSMEPRGVHIDLEKIKESLVFFASRIAELDEKLPYESQGKNGKVTSLQRFNKVCEENGWDTVTTTKKDSPEWIAWRKKYDSVTDLGEVFETKREIVSAKGKLEKIQLKVRSDGTLPLRMEYFGCYTGRWSSKGTNIQNFKRDSVEGVDLRSVIVPAEGHKFVICDLAQIEPRIIFHMANDEETLALIRSGMSIYEAAARTSGEYEGELSLKLANPDLYSSWKARVLGLGYGMGTDRFQMECAKSGNHLTWGEADEIKKDWRRSNPKITAWWNKFDKALKKAVGVNAKAKAETGHAVPMIYKMESGRVFEWLDPKINPEDTSRILVTLPNTDPKKGGLFVEETAWGGTLFQNVIQATARDVLCDMIYRVEQAGYSVRFHVHDELIIETPAEHAEKAYEDVLEIMSTPPVWMPKLPVEATGGIYDQFTK